MIAIKGRRKCNSCGKRYNYYYAKGQGAEKKASFKGKDANGSECTSAKMLSMYSYEVAVNCPECGVEEIFVYTD